ncbi:MAG TPA: amino acid adenylation domain-containing protein, partial [Thermoanaerobaculia bacterium]|nr:amino acid adenylation domain-containing protein [Thermoanaerobaculia bacterium]
GPEVLVGLFFERSLALVVATLAVLEAGGAYVPLDPVAPPARLSSLLAETRVPVVLGTAPLLARLPGATSHRAREMVVDVTGRTPRTPGAATAAARDTTRTDALNLAYLMFTSGSTGPPKAVAVVHRAVVRLVRATEYARFGADEVFLQLAPAAFDAATFEIWGALLNGGRLVLAPPGALSLGEVGALLDRHGVTTLWLTAGLFHQMVDERPGALAGVRQLLAGGDVLSPGHVRRLLAELPGCTLINGYGPTENTTFTCCRPLTGRWDAGASVPIGRPIANTRVYLLDRGLQPVPVGVPGELYAGGDGLARGYLGRPERTAERFVPDPFGAEAGELGGRLYRTGDLVRRRADGDLEFLGRTDQQVKIRGFRVEPGEVEAALVEHPHVRAAVVVAREVAGARALVAYVVGADCRPAAGELRAHLRERLPEPMLPAVFVVLPELPLTPNGKVDRGALPEPEREASPADRSLPRTPVEEVLAGIWAELLGLPRVGIHESFFDLGGHSLLATRVVSRLRDVFGVELPLRALFERPSVAELAAAVESARQGGSGLAAPPLVPMPRDGELPLSFAQERLWFLDQLERGSAAYNVPAAFTLSGSLDVGAFTAAYGAILGRHEALRTTFTAIGGRPVQRISPPAAAPVPVVDLTGLASRQRQAAAERWTAEEARRPFDLAHGPLVRLTVFRLAREEHLAVLNLHHIVSDGWSMGVLVREIGALYPAFKHGQASPLTALPIQYADFALWQRQWLRGEVLAAEIDYWKERLGSAPAALALPTDRPRPAVQTFAGASLAFTLPPELSARLQSLSRRLGATLFMTLLAGFQELLGRYSGQSDLTVGTPVAGRTQLQTEELIGFFVNTLVVRTDLSGEPSFAALVGRVRETLLSAYMHQDLPFERLVEELHPARSLDRTPLFQVVLALQNAPLEQLELAELVIAPVAVTTGTAKFDLTVAVQESASGLSVTVEHNTDLFDGVTARRLIRHWETLLAAAAAAPERRLTELPLLSDVEWLQLADWRGRTSEYPRDATIPALFAAQATAAPEAVALVLGDEVVSYGELLCRARDLAAHLRELGVGPEVLVGLFFERSLALVVATLAVLEAGGAYVPLDPAAPPARLSSLLAETRVPVVLGTASLLARLPGATSHRAREMVVDVTGRTPRTPGTTAAAARDPARADALNLAYLMFTSGSTGPPKGVAVVHRAVVRLVRATEYARFGVDEVFL